ncbi:caffeoylshikimate esterase isoform X3 [Syzygium oleosum]|uniref:caffeoylshikimate esterase isoform X3 n=1 Tax=Syzygium oleosum TaxID=219896 RepID=UPI0024B96213|nr:caffeoylshikimate esterase isoform X3 [Syzygium oleosum]
MDPALTLGFRAPELSLFRRRSDAPFGDPRRAPSPRAARAKPSLSSSASPPSPGTRLTVAAKKRPPIDGLSDEMNAIASQRLDFAPARRRVRAAFTEVQRQLDHCLFKWYETNSNGLQIFCKSWLPKAGVQIKGAVCFCHGYGDTCTFFFEGIARRFASQGYAVYALDHPGFGLSDGLHGYISSFDELVDNVIEQYTKIKERPEVRGLPRFILGQSMGGAVTLKVHLKQPDEWDGVILVAPMCKISDAVRPPEAVVKMLTLMSSILPKAKLFPQKDLAELAFRDLKKRKMAVYNVICYNDQMRLQTASELLRATNDIEARVEKVSSPLLILHGAGDKVTDPSVSKFLYEKASSKDKTLKLYEGGYHCILEGESDEKIFMALDDIVLWLDSRCSPK